MVRILIAEDDVPHPGRSKLSASLPDWTELRLSVSRWAGEAWTLAAGLQDTKRFDDEDIYFEGQVDRRLARSGAYLPLGGAPDAGYRLQIQVRAGYEAPLFAGVSGGLEAGVARYPTGTVTSLQAELRRFPKARDLVVLTGIALLENFGYRQLNNFWRLQGLWQYLRRSQSWGAMTRKGFTASKAPVPQ